MRNLNDLLAEAAKIDAAETRLYKRRRALCRHLKEHRGAVFLVDGCVYSVSTDEYPTIKRVGELNE
jgi:uncharacterized protein (UPF0216 family)